MRKKISIIIGGISIIIFLYLFLSPGYVRNALLHGKVGIEDFNIFNNREIAVGEGIPWKLDSNYNSYELSKEESDILDYYKSVGFLVIKGGKILFEKYWEGYDENSLSNSFSMSKSIISLLIGIAIDEGYISSIDQKVVEILPEFNHTDRNTELSIRNLLTMSSGLNWDESYGSLYSETTKAYYGDDLYNQIIGLKVIEEPGEKYKYLSGNTQLLAIILQKATGMSVSGYASEKLWKKIGAKNPALWSLDKEDGLEKAYCCFNSNLKDFARIGQLVLNNGYWDSVMVVSPEYIKEATTPANYIWDNENNPVRFYGFQWWILHHNDYVIPYARGILGQYIFCVPEKNAVVVRLGHLRDDTQLNYHPEDTYKYIDVALNILEFHESKSINK